MKNAVFLKLVSGALCAAFLLPVTAMAQTIGSELTVMGVVKQADGKEQLSAVIAVKPGDVLQYTATYKNSGKQSAKDMLATLPIPAETVYVASSALPAAAMASVDGKVFEPMPLTRKVKQPDGVLLTVPVPLAEYRFVRWTQRELAAGASFTTSARVRVISSDVALPTAVASAAR